MSKKIKKYLLKRELERILKCLKEHAGLILLIITTMIALITIRHFKKKAKKKIKKAVRAKVRESIDNRVHKEEDDEEQEL